MALVKVFISHKREDSATASRVCAALLSAADVDAYVDVWDPHISGSAEDLVAYVRRQLGGCTHLMVVMSSATQGSWWVPFEIGLATEKEYPNQPLPSQPLPCRSISASGLTSAMKRISNSTHASRDRPTRRSCRRVSAAQPPKNGLPTQRPFTPT